MLYPGVSVLNPPGICGGITVVLYRGNNGNTDLADPAGAKKGDEIGKISSFSFPFVKVTV